jgi:hypothetical protein
MKPLLQNYLKQIFWSLFTATLIVFLAPKILIAGELQAKFQDWSFFKTNRGDKEVCYIASAPIKKNNVFRRRGEPYFIVTNIKNDASEINVSSGFIYNKNYDVELSFYKRKFYLFPYRDNAWADSLDDDVEITKEMQRHEEMTVSGMTESGEIAVDIYSLVGFKKAYKAMHKTCNNSKT